MTVYKLYELLDDFVDALDCRLRAITLRFHPDNKPNNTNTDTQLTNGTHKEKERQEKKQKEEVKIILHLVSKYICKPDSQIRSSKDSENNVVQLGKEYLLLQVKIYLLFLHYNLPVSYRYLIT